MQALDRKCDNNFTLITYTFCHKGFNFQLQGKGKVTTYWLLGENSDGSNCDTSVKLPVWIWSASLFSIYISHVHLSSRDHLLPHPCQPFCAWYIFI